jgi:hypothetical protein
LTAFADFSPLNVVDLPDAFKPADIVVPPGIDYFLTSYGIDGVE